MKRSRIAIVKRGDQFVDPFSQSVRVGDELFGILSYMEGRPDWQPVGIGVPMPPGQTLLHDADIAHSDIAGAIVEGENHAAIALCRERGIPCVAMNRFRDEPDDVPTVCHDDRAIGRLAAQYFLGRGFRSLAFCGPHYLTMRDELVRIHEAISGTQALWVRRRLDGFSAVAKHGGARFSAFYAPEAAAPGESGEACMERFSRDLREWVRGLARPVGILACADVWAMDCLLACQEEGLRVPHNAAVLGVDNEQLRCLACHPTLSSIDRNMRRVGYEAAALLSRTLEGESIGPLSIMVPPLGVVERFSTDTLAVEDQRLAAALRFVRSHFCEPITPGDVAHAVGMSEISLRRLFQQDLRFSISEEIRRLRLEKARDLLLNTDLPLKTIAPAIGLQSHTYLCRLFTREVGVTPAEWRVSRSRNRPGTAQAPRKTDGARS